MASKNWQDAYEAIKPKIADLRDKFAAMEWGGGFALIGKIWTAAQYCIVFAEEVISIVGPLTGQEKEDLAVQAIDDVIQGNFLVEVVDGLVARAIIKVLVKWLNITTGSTAEGVSFLHKGPITIG